MKTSRNIQVLIQQIPFYNIWWTTQRLLVVAAGAFIAALGYSIFQIPFNIAAGGVSGIGIIINHFTGLNEGTLFLIMNIPILIMGFFYLGRWKFLLYTIVSVLTFSITSDVLIIWLPQFLEQYPITNDMLLSAIYAGLVFGIGNGLIHRVGGTIGGTSVIGRIIQIKTGFPLSQAYLYTDGLIIFVSGIIFGWEIALHALLTLFVIGMASDFVIEGPSFVRTATIITDSPSDVTQALMFGLDRGASQWEITGSYTGKTRSMVFCTIYRSQVNELKQIVAAVDDDAFVVIGNAHQALGGGFMILKR
jgi:uncharacterized membrane-anchored protein YitT (DUF2179 family)